MKIVKGKNKMFNENLKLYRNEKNLSQEQLAQQLHVVRQTISKWENGISLPDANLLSKLSDILGVSVGDLLGINIEVPEGKKELDVIEDEISKLNKNIEMYKNKLKTFKRRIGVIIGIIILLVFIGAIYSSWNDVWKDFGKNLYHMLNNIKEK